MGRCGSTAYGLPTSLKEGFPKYLGANYEDLYNDSWSRLVNI